MIWIIRRGITGSGGLSWASSSDADIVDALTKAYNGQIDITEFFSVGDVREVTLTDGRTVHLVLQTNNDNVGGVSADAHGTAAAKFLVTMQEYFKGTSEMYYYGQQASRKTSMTMNELRIPKANETGWETYTFYDLLPTSIKSIFRLFNARAYTRNGDYKLCTVSGDVHFAYYPGYWWNTSKAYNPSGYYDSRWVDSGTFGTTQKESQIPEFVNIDDRTVKAQSIAGLFTNYASNSMAYTQGYIWFAENSCRLAMKSENDGVSFIGMI